jgi:YD repeat-containing protein
MRSGNMLAAVVVGMLVWAGSAPGFTRPASPPEPDSSDDVIVIKVTYDAAGRQKDVIDNKGIITRRTYDDLGRVTVQIEHYTNGTPTSNTNRTTTFAYTADGQIRLQTAVLPAGQDDQTTRYVVKSNSYLRAVIYPDSDDTVSGNALSDGPDSTYDRVELADMRRGTLTGQKDAVLDLGLRQEWVLSPTGNWVTFREDSDGSLSWDLDQARTHNKANEIVTISGGWVDPEHDKAGNMTRLPRRESPAEGFIAVHDDGQNRPDREDHGRQRQYFTRLCLMPG